MKLRLARQARVGDATTTARMTATIALVLALSAPWAGLRAAPATSFTIWTVGNEANVQTSPRGGIALMGGGPDVDDAFRWMLSQSQGGDVVVIRTSGSDGYNDYIAGLDGVETAADSVSTILFRDRSAASNDAVLTMVRQAEALIIAGGDQAEYLRFWKDTPLEAAIMARVADGMTIGGTSAGAVVLGGHVYSGARGSVTSRAALRTPYDRRVTLTSGFLALPGLENVVIDSHVSERHRQGRLVAFMARIARQTRLPIRGIGLDEETAVLIDAAGAAAVIGSGEALILEGGHLPQRCTRKKPLTYRSLSGFSAAANDAFSTVGWTGEGVESVEVSAVRGRLRIQAETP